MAQTLGIDIGGTKIAMALVDDKGAIVAERVFPTSAKGPDENVQRIGEEFNRLKPAMGVHTLQSIGVGIAGQIDKATGTVIAAPNLRWKNVPLKQSLTAIFQAPTVVLNDVRAAAWGEWVHGAGRGFSNLLCIFVGTGIGGAVVSGSRMLQGATNTAGEVGHMIIDIHGRICSCGSQGCLESIAGGWAIAKRAQELAAKDGKGAKELLDLASGRMNEITAKIVFEGLQQGNMISKLIFEEVTEALVAGVVSLVNVVNPACVVMGGGIIDAHPEIVTILQSQVPQKALEVAASNLKIVPAQLGHFAGVIGAAVCAQKDLNGGDIDE